MAPRLGERYFFTRDTDPSARLPVHGRRADGAISRGEQATRTPTNMYVSAVVASTETGFSFA